MILHVQHWEAVTFTKHGTTDRPPTKKTRTPQFILDHCNFFSQRTLVETLQEYRTVEGLCVDGLSDPETFQTRMVLKHIETPCKQPDGVSLVHCLKRHIPRSSIAFFHSLRGDRAPWRADSWKWHFHRNHPICLVSFVFFWWFSPDFYFIFVFLQSFGFMSLLVASATQRFQVVLPTAGFSVLGATWDPVKGKGRIMASLKPGAITNFNHENPESSIQVRGDCLRRGAGR